MAAAAAMGGRQGQDHGGPSPTARVGPGGLPTASSWRSLKVGVNVYFRGGGQGVEFVSRSFPACFCCCCLCVDTVLCCCALVLVLVDGSNAL